MGILINKANNRVLSNVNNFYSIGAGLKFDGVNDFVSLPNFSLTNGLRSDPFSISIFLKSNDFTWHNYFALPGFTRIDIFGALNGFNPNPFAIFYPFVFATARGFI